MTIYVIRHADKENGDFYTAPLPLNNQPISEFGRQQALRLVPYFDSVEIDSIHVSRYVRTEQTIAPLVAVKGLIPQVDARLDEINIGAMERLSEEQIAQDYPEFWSAFHERNRDFRFPDGESGDECGERIREAFDALDPAHNHILVAHDGVIRVLICKILGLPTYRRHLFTIDLCSITTFKYNAQFHCWMVPQINYTIRDS